MSRNLVRKFYRAAARLLTWTCLAATTACSGGTPAPTASEIPPTAPQTAAHTAAFTSALSAPAATETATPQPLAARVNGAGILLSDYEAELARLKDALGTELAAQDQQQALDDLIDQALLVQGAAEGGFQVTPEALQQRLDALASQAGGSLDQWIAAQHYTAESFRQALARSITAAWMRDQIAAGVPQATEQVHARQILVYNSDKAAEVTASLSAGGDFATLAAQYDPVTRGDLGWFPQGYLLDPDLEAAVFALQPGETSQVVQTSAGYHVLQVIERDPQHPLDPQARLILQEHAVRDWLAARREQSKIEIILP